MPRPKSMQPGYRFHVSGQARVTLDGRDYLLGKHGSPESWAKYHALLAEYVAGGMKMPDPDMPGSKVERLADESIQVRHVTADFRARRLPRYENSEGSYVRFRVLLELLDQKHGNDDPNDFGPRKLEALRDGFIAAGNCRKYANERTRNIIRIFKHGVARELVNPEVITALECVEPLRPGEAKDHDRPQAAPLESVLAAIAEAPKPVCDMLSLQRLTAMRPGELFTMTPADIDRSGDDWFYCPEHHKTAHHGKRREVPIVGVAKTILGPYLFADGLCFVNTRDNAWTRNSYRLAVERACKKAGVPKFAPYRIRHLTAQAVRDGKGAEHVQALLGHSRISTLEHYSQASRERAVEAAKLLQA